MQLKEGQRVRYSFLAPAISCEWNGRRITGDGKILEFEDDIWLIVERWPDDDYPVRIRRSEVTHVKRWWGWKKMKESRHGRSQDDDGGEEHEGR